MFFFCSFWVFCSPSYFTRILRLLLFFHLIIFFLLFLFSHRKVTKCYFISLSVDQIAFWPITSDICHASYFFSSAYLFVVIFSYYSNLYSISFFFSFVLFLCFLELYERVCQSVCLSLTCIV